MGAPGQGRAVGAGRKTGRKRAALVGAALPCPTLTSPHPHSTKNSVLYIDIDVHHGDGVEEAFLTTDRVFCVRWVARWQGRRLAGSMQGRSTRSRTSPHPAPPRPTPTSTHLPAPASPQLPQVWRRLLPRHRRHRQHGARCAGGWVAAEESQQQASGSPARARLWGATQSLSHGAQRGLTHASPPRRQGPRLLTQRASARRHHGCAARGGEPGMRRPSAHPHAPSSAWRHRRPASPLSNAPCAPLPPAPCRAPGPQTRPTTRCSAP